MVFDKADAFLAAPIPLPGFIRKSRCVVRRDAAANNSSIALISTVDIGFSLSSLLTSSYERG